ncbi:MAG: hypothetical protein IRY99_21575 [Isosphaeraceae bacterium]|nr:hypothetical protein [Isosphaeraceae bacterium]
MSALLGKSERQLLGRLLEVCWGAQRPGVYPEVALGDLMGRGEVVRLLELPRQEYSVSEAKLMALAALTVRVRARVAFEFGTADGRTTRNLAANIAADGRVYTLSLPLEQDAVHRQLQTVPIGARFRGTPEADRITQLWGDSRTFDFTPYEGRCQLVFLDADSSDAAVWADSQTALRLVDRTSGLILWNDALKYGWQTALPRLARQGGWPIHLISDIGLALLCFMDGQPVLPHVWSESIESYPAAQAEENGLVAIERGPLASG